MGIGSHNMTLSASREPGHPVAGFRWSLSAWELEEQWCKC
jgi:hypothetical protein